VIGECHRFGRPVLHLLSRVRGRFFTGLSMISGWGRETWWLIIVAWLLFVVSMFRPATNVIGSDERPATGFEAAMACASGLLTVYSVLLTILDGRAIVLWGSPFFNVVMLLAPWLVYRNPANALWIATILVPAAIGPLILPAAMTGDVFVGFYVWVASFVVMIIGCALFYRANES
jgi:hypothetical protein